MMQGGNRRAGAVRGRNDQQLDGCGLLFTIGEQRDRRTRVKKKRKGKGREGEISDQKREVPGIRKRRRGPCSKWGRGNPEPSKEKKSGNAPDKGVK